MKRFIKGLKKGQKEFGDSIATLINSILLTFVYVFGVGFTAIFAKIFNKKFLEMELNNSKSYWTDLNLGISKMEDYYRQF